MFLALTTQSRQASILLMAIQAAIELLSTDQLKQWYEAKGLSVVEWIEFDADDVSTWPETDEDGYIEIDFCEVGHNGVFTGGLTIKPSGQYKLILESGGDVGGAIKYRVKTPFFWSYRPKPPKILQRKEGK